MIVRRQVLGGRIPLEGRAQIHKLDAGLTSVRGAQEIINMISERRTVTKLVLGHNNLGNEGTNVLFRFLESALGRKYPISEISLNSNGIKNEGLLAISRYLRGNREMKELFLQANGFTGDPLVTKAFVEALNSSGIEVLSLTTNHGLGDTFIEHFMALLDAPHLRELHISSIGLTPRSVPHIANYIRSPQRCRLHTFRCNGNSLGLRGVKSLIQAIEQANYSLLSVEVFANQLTGDPGDLEEYASEEDDEEEVVDETAIEAWTACVSHLKRLSLRNEHFRRETQAQAIDLLRYSRILLLRSVVDQPQVTASPPSDPDHSSNGLEQHPGGTFFPFKSLPTELQLSILSLLAPSLSSAQRSRVFSYAADPSTLPPLLPPLRRRQGCLPNPAGTPNLFPGGLGHVWKVHGQNSSDCSAGQCMGTTNTAACNKDKERSSWLDAVGCSVYEPE